MRVHVSRDPATGRLTQVSRTTRNGIAEARRIRARLVTEIAQGKRGGETHTVAELLEDCATLSAPSRRTWAGGFA